MGGTHVLAVSCASRPGIVAAVANTLFGEGRNILDAQKFDGILANRFLMRRVFDGGK
ncbi:MAG: formyltetrahydrofolate deformylase, partial [Methylobacterium sp.]|nr:formyltetrahydrofolate deformylase [Methylobacterium sp.]